MKESMQNLVTSYEQAVEGLCGEIRSCIRQAGGFINTANNNGKKTDIVALVADSSTGGARKQPVRALRVAEDGDIEVYLGHSDTIYTEKYLKGKNSAEHWFSLKGSSIYFHQTVLSIAGAIEEYL